jgi:hypothetical protein
MAEEKAEPRDWNIRHLMPWTLLFRGFQVAIDPKKLLLAAAGIVTMAFGWWVLAVVFYSLAKVPVLGDGYYKTDMWPTFKEDRRQWNLLYQAAGAWDRKLAVTDVNDVVVAANDENLYRQMTEPGSGLSDKFATLIDKQIEDGRVAPGQPSEIIVDGKSYPIYYKAYGQMRSLPWFEDRGPNPYLLLTGQAGRVNKDGTPGKVPWVEGQFVPWFLTTEVPVLLEPLVKLLRPVTFLLKPNAGYLNKTYFVLVLLVTLAVWALFGGAITRMAAVELTRNEKVGLVDAVRYTADRYLSYLAAPLVPLLIIGVMLLAYAVYGFVQMIPVLGDVLTAVLFPLMLIGGLVMTVLLLGLLGWPMMYATLSTEGSDSFDAISRTYSYFYQSTWHYAWYCLVSLAYGMVLVFVVGLIGSMAVLLPKLGLNQTPFLEAADRDPSYLFIYAPTSYEWRELLVRGSSAASQMKLDTVNPSDLKEFKHWWGFANYIGLFAVTAWLYLTFLAVVGFGYSYFWSSGTIIYLLMRRQVDDTELDEVYLEEEDIDEAPSVVSATTPAPAAGGSTPLTMVEPPALRTVSPATPPEVSPTLAPTPAPTEHAAGAVGSGSTATVTHEVSDAPAKTDGDVTK